MRIALSFLLAAAILGAGGVQAQDKRARTEDGKDVILKADGTWSYADEGKRGKKGKKAEGYAKDKDATLAYKGKRGTFALYLLPGTWRKLDKTGSDVAEVGFAFKDGDVQALIIAERIEVPLDTLRKVAVEGMQAIDKNGKVTFEEKRTVNGTEVLCLTMEASVQGIALTYHGYYYTGDEGSFQVLTWTGRKLFKELKPEMEVFLNGFELVKKQD